MKSSEDMYIVLVSNASMDLFPDNSICFFRTRLSHPIQFTDNIEVALTDISFTKSWFNLPNSYVIKLSVDGTPEPDFPAELSEEINLPSGFYEDPGHLIKVINSLIATKETIAGVTKLPQLEYRNSRIKTSVIGECVYGSQTYTLSVNFSDNLVKELGGLGNNPVSFANDITELFVRADVIEPSFFGSNMDKILRIITLDRRYKFGEQVSYVFDNPYYMKLSRTIIQEIQIDIKSNHNTHPSFKFGRSELTLHFKNAELSNK